MKVVVTLLFCCVLVSAQSTGSLRGVVTDASGGVVPGVTVTLSSESGEKRVLETDAAGTYNAPLLRPGLYTITFAKQGFGTKRFESVGVIVTEIRTLDAQLGVSRTEQSVTVAADAALVETTNAATGRVVDNRTMDALPLATRNFTQVLGLSPGAATYLPDNTAVGRNSQNISVNGARVTNNNFMINGVDANSMGTNSAPSLPVPAPETIQEFKVQTSLYDATFGRSGGGSIQAVTKSGTNNLHGGAYEYFRNEDLNANNPFLKAAGLGQPVLKRNVFGATIGGPIKKDKSYFFASYQGTRESNGASPINSLSSNVLVAPGLTDDRSSATLVRTFGTLIAPLTSINPIALAMLNARLPSGGYMIPTPQANGRYTGSTPSVYDENQFNANVDYRFGDKNSLALKFFFFNAPQTLVLPSFLGGGPNVPGFGNFQQNNGRLVTLQDIHIFTPRVVNELRAGYNFLRVDAFPQEPIKDSDLGITRANAASFPGLGLVQIAPSAGGVVFGSSPTIDVRATAPSTTLADTISWSKGRHSIRAGGEMRYNENNYVLNYYVRGQIQYASFANFLQGVPLVSVFGSGIGNRSLRATDYNFFVQDDWKITSHLTLNLGLRYDLDMPAYDTRGRFSTFDPGLYVPRPLSAGGVPVGPPIGGYVQANNVIPAYALSSATQVDKRLVKSVDPNNFAPRVGFAWSPNSKLVTRGGYGIYYSRTSFQYATLTVIMPPTYVFGTSILPPNANPFFPAPPTSAYPTLVPGVSLSGTVLDRNIRTPYIQQWNASVQYELKKDLLLEVGYVGTHGLNLFRSVGINQPSFASAANPITNAVTGQVITTNTAANASLRAPYQGVSLTGFLQNQSTAQSSYNSLQSSLTKRFSHGLQFLASYTWAKSIDNGSGQGGGAGTGGTLNPGAVGETVGILGNQFDNRGNRGVSDFNRKHRLVLSGSWMLPKPGFAGNSAAGNFLFSNWQLSGILTVMSGLPIDIIDTGAGSLYGFNGAALSRPNYAPGATIATATSGAPAGFWINPAAFARPVVLAGAAIPSTGGKYTAATAGTDLGSVGRNILTGPGQSNLDFSISKTFPVKEIGKLEFRTDFFNMFNHVNLANPISDLNSVAAAGGALDATTGLVTSPGSAFGRIISTSNNPRIVQFALKFTF